MTTVAAANRHPTTVAAICALGPCLLGTAFLATQNLPNSPLWNAVERVLPAGLVLIAIRPALPKGQWWARSALLGVLNFGSFFALQAAAAHRLPGAVVATITAAQALLVPALLAAFGEKVPRLHYLVALPGFLGVALLTRGDYPLDRFGVLASVLLACSGALGLVLTRRWGRPEGVHHVSTTAWQMLAGAIALLPLAALAEGAPPSMTANQLVFAWWLAVPATALAFALFFGGLHSGLPATTVSRLALLSPVMATMLGSMFAREWLNATQLVGIALVLTAQWSVVRQGARRCRNEQSSRDLTVRSPD